MKNKSAAFIEAKDVLVEDLGDGIKRQILGYNDSLMVARVVFEAGAEGYVHAHPHSQVSYVESGEFDVFIDGERKRLGPGDSFCVQPNLDHGAVCRKAGVLLDVFSPAREDFLDAGDSS
ncbi:MAG: cupin domain-containing protein [Pseudomonadota bacterium]